VLVLLWLPATPAFLLATELVRANRARHAAVASRPEQIAALERELGIDKSDS
jgi:hypothetical protein